MILEIHQEEKELWSARFTILRAGDIVGKADVKGKPGHREADISGKLFETEFGLKYGKNKHITSKPFRPYKININGAETGAVYQAEQKAGLFQSRSFHQMVRDGRTYECYAVALAGEKIKHPIYCGSEQTALVETDEIIYNDLFHFYIYAGSEDAGLTALLFCLYMYINACYKPGEKVTQSVSKSSFVTKDPFLLEKYNPDFKKGTEA